MCACVGRGSIGREGGEVKWERGRNPSVKYPGQKGAELNGNGGEGPDRGSVK